MPPLRMSQRRAAIRLWMGSGVDGYSGSPIAGIMHGRAYARRQQAPSTSFVASKRGRLSSVSYLVKDITDVDGSFRQPAQCHKALIFSAVDDPGGVFRWKRFCGLTQGRSAPRAESRRSQPACGSAGVKPTQKTAAVGDAAAKGQPRDRAATRIRIAQSAPLPGFFVPQKTSFGRSAADFRFLRSAKYRSRRAREMRSRQR